jgi:DNA polymerase-3 subunit epsilon|uniref:DNA polymerase III subunit alpha n=2 Tax=root TaxID=1 RepID=A0A8S5SNJ1_9CAUD|nr:MAG TPA: DNA polymerase III subunit alpha [Siphoviridae sp. ctAjZ17]
MTIGIDILTGEKINFSHDRHYKGKSIVSFPDDYCVIDIETTGLSPDWDSIIEIAAEKFHKGNLVDTFSSFVKPDDFEDAEPFLDDFIVDLTGITDEMLSTADSTASVLSRFYSFIGDSILIGHNVNFDINFLYDNCERVIHEHLSNDFIDTMKLSRRIHKDFSHHKLSDLVQYYNLDYQNAHRALADVEITSKCYVCLINEILENFKSIDAFNDAFERSRHGVKANDISTSKTEFDTSNLLYGKVCVFTGTLEKMVRKEAMQIVADLGGKNADNVTKKTNYLILGNNDYCKSIKAGKSSKQKKAEKLKLDGYDIEIIPENVFYDIISEN